MDFFFPAAPGTFPDAQGYFGAFGGQFVPQALVAAVDQVAAEYERAKADPAFVARFEDLLAHYVGRPSALTEVPRFAAHAGGARVFLKREDLNHTGSHKVNNALGQALLAKRMGKTRVIAETGAGSARRRHRHRLRADRPRLHRLHGRDRTSAARRSTWHGWNCSAPRSSR